MAHLQTRTEIRAPNYLRFLTFYLGKGDVTDCYAYTIISYIIVTVIITMDHNVRVCVCVIFRIETCAYIKTWIM